MTLTGRLAGETLRQHEFPVVKPGVFVARAAGITASLRADRAGQEYLRLSAHFYNTDEELQRTLDLL